jgi:hypothetical protein
VTFDLCVSIEILREHSMPRDMKNNEHAPLLLSAKHAKCPLSKGLADQVL